MTSTESETPATAVERHPAGGRSRDLRSYFSLILYKSYAELRSESERTYIGFAWWIVEPVISMAVYYFVFSVILKRGTENYVAFLFAGLVPWRWFASTIMRATNAILSARGLMQQVFLPKVVFPLVNVVTDTAKFSIVFVLMLVYFVLAGPPPGVHYLGLAPILLAQGLLITGLSMLAAGATPFLPDVRIVLQNLVRLWFFLSGVFYDISMFPEKAQFYLRLNPMAVLIESYRDILVHGRWPDFGVLAATAGLGLLLAMIAAAGISHFDYEYPKLGA